MVNRKVKGPNTGLQTQLFSIPIYLFISHTLVFTLSSYLTLPYIYNKTNQLLHNNFSLITTLPSSVQRDERVLLSHVCVYSLDVSE